MLDTKVVQVTGRGTKVNFVIDDSAPFEAVSQGLQEHLKEHRSLYSSGTITVNVGKRLLEREEITQIKEILEKQSGITVSRFWCPPHLLEEALSESIGFGVAVSPDEAPARDGETRSKARESRQLDSLREAEDTGLERWVAYVLDRPEIDERTATTRLADGPVANEQPAVVEDVAAEEAQDQEIIPGEAPEGRADSEEAPTFDMEQESAGDEDESTEELEPPLETSPALPTTGEQRDTEIAAQPAAPPEPEPVMHIEPKREVVGLYRGNETLLIKTTCRSGEVIRYPGDVVVMADVNPGAEVIADGDILVFGSLRGLAHAGAGGDIQATIIALNLDTHRLQIGPYTGVAPKSNKRSKSNSSDPRIAFVRRRSIYVAPYVGRFAGYSGGTLYDG